MIQSEALAGWCSGSGQRRLPKKIGVSSGSSGWHAGGVPTLFFWGAHGPVLNGLRVCCVSKRSDQGRWGPVDLGCLPWLDAAALGWRAAMGSVRNLGCTFVATLKLGIPVGREVVVDPLGKLRCHAGSFVALVQVPLPFDAFTVLREGPQRVGRNRRARGTGLGPPSRVAAWVFTGASVKVAWMFGATACDPGWTGLDPSWGCSSGGVRRTGLACALAYLEAGTHASGLLSGPPQVPVTVPFWLENVQEPPGLADLQAAMASAVGRPSPPPGGPS